MTLEQLEEELPNGLHDAQIRSITRNFENGTLTLALHIHVGLLDDPPEERERYRNGMITFSGVELFVVESPEASSAFASPGGVWFNASRSEVGLLPADIEAKLTQATLRYSFFVLDWHSHIHIAASGMSFAWETGAYLGAGGTGF
jgi:hypothetical protein